MSYARTHESVQRTRRPAITMAQELDGDRVVARKRAAAPPAGMRPIPFPQPARAELLDQLIEAEARLRMVCRALGTPSEPVRPEDVDLGALSGPAREEIRREARAAVFARLTGGA